MCATVSHEDIILFLSFFFIFISIAFMNTARNIMSIMLVIGLLLGIFFIFMSSVSIKPEKPDIISSIELHEDDIIHQEPPELRKLLTNLKSGNLDEEGTERLIRGLLSSIEKRRKDGNPILALYEILFCIKAMRHKEKLKFMKKQE